MAGYVYLIRNGDLHKIGRTDHLERRLKQLQPCVLVQSLKTDRSRDLEHELHQQFKSKRLPQSEYFRLTEDQVKRVRIALGWNPPKELEYSQPVETVPSVVILPEEISEETQEVSGLETEQATVFVGGVLTGLSGLLFLTVVLCIPRLPDSWGFLGYFLAGIGLSVAQLLCVLCSLLLLIASVNYCIRWSKQKASDGIRGAWQKLSQRQG